MSAPVWFITGCSSGFGLALAKLALSRNHHVIATSRTPSRTPALVTEIESMGGTWLALDVCGPDVKDVVEEAIKIHGRIDVLVNNAGFCLLGAFETFRRESDEECRSQMETNFFAPMLLTRLLLPSMRLRGSGTIVNISSTAGIEAKASRTLYSASKFALEGFSEALWNEMKPLGVRVLLVEPGAFRSQFAGNMIAGAEMPKEYQGTITQQTLDAVKAMANGYQAPGDVEKGVQAIFDVVMGQGQGEGMGDFLRLPLGKDGSARWEVKLGEMKRNLDATEKIWRGTDCDV